MGIKSFLHKSIVTLLFGASCYYAVVLSHSSYLGFSGKPERKKVTEGDIAKRITEIKDKFDEIENIKKAQESSAKQK